MSTFKKGDKIVRKSGEGHHLLTPNKTYTVKDPHSDTSARGGEWITLEEAPGEFLSRLFDPAPLAEPASGFKKGDKVRTRKGSRSATGHPGDPSLIRTITSRDDDRSWEGDYVLLAPAEDTNGAHVPNRGTLFKPEDLFLDYGHDLPAGTRVYWASGTYSAFDRWAHGGSGVVSAERSLSADRGFDVSVTVESGATDRWGTGSVGAVKNFRRTDLFVEGEIAWPLATPVVAAAPVNPFGDAEVRRETTPEPDPEPQFAEGDKVRAVGDITSGYGRSVAAGTVGEVTLPRPFGTATAEVRFPKALGLFALTDLEKVSESGEVYIPDAEGSVIRVELLDGNYRGVLEDRIHVLDASGWKAVWADGGPWTTSGRWYSEGLKRKMYRVTVLHDAGATA